MYEFAPPSFMKSQQLKDEEALIYFFRDLKCRVLGRKCANIEKFIVSKQSMKNYEQTLITVNDLLSTKNQYQILIPRLKSIFQYLGKFKDQKTNNECLKLVENFPKQLKSSYQSAIAHNNRLQQFFQQTSSFLDGKVEKKKELLISPFLEKLKAIELKIYQNLCYEKLIESVGNLKNGFKSMNQQFNQIKKNSASDEYITNLLRLREMFEEQYEELTSLKDSYGAIVGSPNKNRAKIQIYKEAVHNIIKQFRVKQNNSLDQNDVRVIEATMSNMALIKFSSLNQNSSKIKNQKIQGALRNVALWFSEMEYTLKTVLKCLKQIQGSSLTSVEKLQFKQLMSQIVKVVQSITSKNSLQKQPKMQTRGQQRLRQSYVRVNSQADIKNNQQNKHFMRFVSVIKKILMADESEKFIQTDVKTESNFFPNTPFGTQLKELTEIALSKQKQLWLGKSNPLKEPLGKFESKTETIKQCTTCAELSETLSLLFDQLNNAAKLGLKPIPKAGMCRDIFLDNRNKVTKWLQSLKHSQKVEETNQIMPGKLSTTKTLQFRPNTGSTKKPTLVDEGESYKLKTQVVELRGKNKQLQLELQEEKSKVEMKMHEQNILNQQLNKKNNQLLFVQEQRKQLERLKSDLSICSAKLREADSKITIQSLQFETTKNILAQQVSRKRFLEEINIQFKVKLSDSLRNIQGRQNKIKQLEQFQSQARANSAILLKQYEQLSNQLQKEISEKEIANSLNIKLQSLCKEVEEEKKRRDPYLFKQSEIFVFNQRQNLNGLQYQTLPAAEIFIQEIERITCKRIKSARLLYKYRSDNKLTQKHFINRPNILTVAKTRKNVLVAAYTTQKFEASRPKVIEDVPIKALLMNFDLENRQHMAFPLHYGRDSVDYGSDRICYGNSELRIEAGSTKMMCNVGYKGHAFDTGNKAVKEFLKQEKGYTTELQTFEIYQIYYQGEDEIQMLQQSSLQSSVSSSSLREKNDSVVRTLEKQIEEYREKSIEDAEHISKLQQKVQMMMGYENVIQQLRKEKQQILMQKNNEELLRRELVKKEMDLTAKISALERSLNTSVQQENKRTQKAYIVKTDQQSNQQLRNELNTLNMLLERAQSQNKTDTEEALKKQNNLIAQNRMLQEQIISLESRVNQSQKLKTELKAEIQEAQKTKIESQLISCRSEPLPSRDSLGFLPSRESVQFCLSDYLFQGGIFQNQKLQQSRRYLVEAIESHVGQKLKRTTLIFKQDPLNETSFHKYIDNRSGFVFVLQSNEALIAGYYEGALVTKGEMTEDALLISLTFKKSYRKKDSRGKVLTYDAYSFIFGNSQVMTRRKDRVVESKFAMMNNCFEKNGDTVNMIINKDDERISTYNNLEFHQVYFADR